MAVTQSTTLAPYDPAQDIALMHDNRKAVEEKFAPHRLYAFTVPPEKKDSLIHLARQIALEECENGKSNLLGDVLRQFNPHQYPDMPGTFCYHDTRRDWYYWKTTGNNEALGICYRRNGQIDILLPDKVSEQEHLIALGYRDEGEPGFAGTQLLYVKHNGQVGFVANSEHHKTQGNPGFSRNIIRLSEFELTQHLSHAKMAAAAHLSARPFTAEALRPESARTVNPNPHELNAGGFVERVLQERAIYATYSLPNHIRVTSPEGRRNFELHCAPFRERNCLDENGQPYEATVYVLKKAGADFRNEKSQSLILELRDNGEMRIRSGYKGQESVQAIVHFLHQGEYYQAQIGTRNGKPAQYWDQTRTNTPFRPSGKPTYMCIRGCSSHYSELNKQRMEAPDLLRQSGR